MMEPGLYLVATPIGNLDDMTFRGVEVLKNADLIGAEDTRHSRILLQHFDIKTPLLSYHEHNESKRREEFLDRLRQGQVIALISDAGTPGISDPGADIVAAAAAEGIPIHPVPGGNAVLSAVISSAIDCARFTFQGFLPRVKKERKERIEEIGRSAVTSVIYVSPHRVKDDLHDLYAALGDRKATLCRELTKIHETFYYGTLGSLKELANEEELKGEMVLVIAAGDNIGETEAPSEDALRAELADLMAQGVKAKAAAQIVADKYHMKKNQVYPLTIGDGPKGE
ncbi:MAG: 16S rRNA (cytidine(1402)-2'-O)-methyltransferase [Firmicutes bacterium]|nr:16S rRNA (cytidine(1402)-2'-O)-methyltransferase [Bacillota bacterium]